MDLQKGFPTITHANTYANTCISRVMHILINYTVKNIRRIYGRIAGNQLPGQVPLIFTGTRKKYLAWQDRKKQDSVTNGSVVI